MGLTRAMMMMSHMVLGLLVLLQLGGMTRLTRDELVSRGSTDLRTVDGLVRQQLQTCTNDRDKQRMIIMETNEQLRQAKAVLEQREQEGQLQEDSGREESEDVPEEEHHDDDDEETCNESETNESNDIDESNEPFDDPRAYFLIDNLVQLGTDGPLRLAPAANQSPGQLPIRRIFKDINQDNLGTFQGVPQELITTIFIWIPVPYVKVAQLACRTFYNGLSLYRQHDTLGVERAVAYYPRGCAALVPELLLAKKGSDLTILLLHRPPIMAAMIAAVEPDGKSIEEKECIEIIQLTGNITGTSTEAMAAEQMLRQIRTAWLRAVLAALALIYPAGRQRPSRVHRILTAIFQDGQLSKPVQVALQSLLLRAEQ